MGIVRQLLRDFGYIHRPDIPRNARRAYAAAGMNRLSGDWLTTATSIDHDIRSGMVAVRSRARDLSQNSEFAKAYLRAVRKNVALLALALARPAILSEATDLFGQSKVTGVIVLDNSYSMGMSDGTRTRFEKAQEVALQAIKERHPSRLRRRTRALGSP